MIFMVCFLFCVSDVVNVFFVVFLVFVWVSLMIEGVFSCVLILRILLVVIGVVLMGVMGIICLVCSDGVKSVMVSVSVLIRRLRKVGMWCFELI